MKKIIKNLFTLSMKILQNLFWHKPNYFKVNGYHLYLDPIDGNSALLRRFGLWEPAVSKFNSNHLIKKDFGCVFEFGSAFGEFSNFMAKTFQPQVRIVGLEPFPRYFMHLQKTKSKNILNNPNVEFFNIGIGSTMTNFEFTMEDNPYHGLENVIEIKYDIAKTSQINLNNKVVFVPALPLNLIINKLVVFAGFNIL